MQVVIVVDKTQEPVYAKVQAHVGLGSIDLHVKIKRWRCIPCCIMQVVPDCAYAYRCLVVHANNIAAIHQA